MDSTLSFGCRHSGHPKVNADIRPKPFVSAGKLGLVEPAERYLQSFPPEIVSQAAIVLYELVVTVCSLRRCSAYGSRAVIAVINPARLRASNSGGGSAFQASE